MCKTATPFLEVVKINFTQDACSSNLCGNCSNKTFKTEGKGIDWKSFSIEKLILLLSESNNARNE